MKKRRLIGSIVACLVALPLLAQNDPGAKQPSSRLVFVKEFPGSVPDYYSVTVAENGEAIYATAPDDPEPLRFRLSPSLARQFFDAAARLNYFKDARFETRRKVAAMGKKTFRYEGNGQRYETSFNYSDNPEAMALAGAFEKISTTEQHLLNLERLVRHDRLGVMKQLVQIEISLNKRELVEPGQLVPLLEEIAGNSQFLHIAQERARYLLRRFQGDYTPALFPAGTSRQ